ncbi:MAG: tail fiber protein [Tardiphaga sp.]
MSDPFIGEIQAFPFDGALSGFNRCWLPCFGQLLPLQKYSPLYALIGITYGGNGTTNFALPNLSGSVAISQNAGARRSPGELSPRVIGSMVGSSTVTLTAGEIASHSHILQLGNKSAPRATSGPGAAGALAAIDPNFSGFIAPAGNADTTLSPNVMTSTGGGLPHDNMQPTLVLVWCIATAGVFPTFG